MIDGKNRKISSFRRITIKTRREKDEVNPEHHKFWNTSSSKRFCIRLWAHSSIRNSANKDDFGIGGAGLAYLFLKFSGWA